MKKRITLRQLMVNTFVMAIVAYVWVGFTEHFDAFGLYGAAWSARIWGVWLLLFMWCPFILAIEWWKGRKRVDQP